MLGDVFLSRPVTIASRRTPAQQPLPSRLMNCRWPVRTSRVVGWGPDADMNARDQAAMSSQRCATSGLPAFFLSFGVDIPAQFGCSDQTTAAIFLRFELAGFDAVVKGCPADAKDMGSLAAYGYREGKVDKGEAYIVQEIFGRLADGACCRTIAAELNARRIPSPGSTWSRTVLRASGWMGSGVRVISPQRALSRCSSVEYVRMAQGSRHGQTQASYASARGVDHSYR